MANTTAKKQRRSERIAIQQSESARPLLPPLNIPSLPVEIKEMIFKELGKPPQESYLVDEIHDIHPCYAICSTNKQFQAIYLRTATIDLKMILSDNIEITIRPNDYLVPDEDIGKALSARLELLGYYGRARITSCHIYGDQLKRETGDARLTKWLTAGQVKKRLEPEHKVLLKQHIEQDLSDKAAAIEKLFKLVNEMLPGVTTLKISPGEIPSNIWHGPVKQWILQHKNTLIGLEFVKMNTFMWRLNYHYINRLSAKFGLLDVREAPSNYPPTDWDNQRTFEDLVRVTKAYIKARDGLTQFTPVAWSW